MNLAIGCSFVDRAVTVTAVVDRRLWRSAFYYRSMPTVDDHDRDAAALDRDSGSQLGTGPRIRSTSSRRCWTWCA